MDIRDMRRQYETGALDEQDAAADPVEQFTTWFDEVAKAGAVLDPNAMVLSTVGEDGRPSSRVVLMKTIDEGGLKFFTNYTSRKGRELSGNPRAAALFHWPPFDRVVRVEGTVEQTTAEDSDEYFAMRPVPSQIGAIASPQSEVISSRSVLEANERAAAEKYGDKPERPASWGGYILVPDYWEFWQGRESRLHDRLRYTPEGDGWKIDRLAP